MYVWMRAGVGMESAGLCGDVWVFRYWDLIASTIFEGVDPVWDARLLRVQAQGET